MEWQADDILWECLSAVFLELLALQRGLVLKRAARCPFLSDRGTLDVMQGPNGRLPSRDPPLQGEPLTQPVEQLLGALF